MPRDKISVSSQMRCHCDLKLGASRVCTMIDRGELTENSRRTHGKLRATWTILVAVQFVVPGKAAMCFFEGMDRLCLEY